MSQFSRRAAWLNILFPASRAPTKRDPSSRSDDVSLVQPYDGGGLNFEQRFFSGAPAAGLDGDVLITTIPNDEVFRLMGIQWNKDAGAGNPVCRLLAENSMAEQCAICTNHTFGSANDRPESPNNIMGKVLGPGTLVRFEYFASGDAATVVTCTIYGIAAPQGTVFYV